jgi:D-3-phosphoglycerate dehydrogenase / 2-oxoglutarate reductase
MGSMARILVTEAIAEGGLDRLREAGHTVDVRLGLSPDELSEAIRSTTSTSSPRRPAA